MFLVLITWMRSHFLINNHVKAEIILIEPGAVLQSINIWFCMNWITEVVCIIVSNVPFLKA